MKFKLKILLSVIFIIITAVQIKSSLLKQENPTMNPTNNFNPIVNSTNPNYLNNSKNLKSNKSNLSNKTKLKTTQEINAEIKNTNSEPKVVVNINGEAIVGDNIIMDGVKQSVKFPEKSNTKATMDDCKRLIYEEDCKFEDKCKWILTKEKRQTCTEPKIVDIGFSCFPTWYHNNIRNIPYPEECPLPGVL